MRQCEKFKLSHFVSGECTKSTSTSPTDNYLVYDSPSLSAQGRSRVRHRNMVISIPEPPATSHHRAHPHENGRRDYWISHFKFSKCRQQPPMPAESMCRTGCEGARMTQLKLCMRVRSYPCVFFVLSAMPPSPPSPTNEPIHVYVYVPRMFSRFRSSVLCALLPKYYKRAML